MYCNQVISARQRLVDLQTREHISCLQYILQVFGYANMCVYSLTDDRVQPGGVALRNLEAGQSAGFDDEVIHTKLDILGFHLLGRGGEVV